MPAFSGPFLGFALGAALAWLGREEAARVDDRAFPGPRSQIAALFAILVYAPICAYFLMFAGDWSLAYLADGARVPSALTLLLVALDAAAVVAGFLAADVAHRRRAPGLAAALAAFPAAIALAIVLALLHCLRVDGTFRQVRAGFGTQPVAGGPLGYALLWMHALLVAGFVVASRALGERTRAATPPDAPASPDVPIPRVALLGRARKR